MSENPTPTISRFFNYRQELKFMGPIKATDKIITEMKICGYLKQDAQVKINLRLSISRISDYFTRATVDPTVADGWWFEDDKICSGTEDEYRARRDDITPA